MSDTRVGSTLVESISIEDEKRFFHVIDDIRVELSMIKAILLQQEEVWKDFATQAWPQYWPDGPDGRFKPKLTDAASSLKNYREIWNKI